VSRLVRLFLRSEWGGARMTRLDRDARMSIKTLVSRGTTNTTVARLMGVTEGSRTLPRVADGDRRGGPGSSTQRKPGGASISNRQISKTNTKSTNWRSRHGLDDTVERRHRRCFARGGARALEPTWSGLQVPRSTPTGGNREIPRRLPRRTSIQTRLRKL
jgi:hypothetical protein